QRRHRILLAGAVLNKNRIDQVVCGQSMLAHEAARKFIAPHSALTTFGEFSGKAHVVSVRVCAAWAWRMLARAWQWGNLGNARSARMVFPPGAPFRSRIIGTISKLRTEGNAVRSQTAHG